MHMIELKDQQNSAPTSLECRRLLDVGRDDCAPREQNTKKHASTPSRISAQQFRERRWAERLRGRRFAEPSQ